MKIRLLRDDNEEGCHWLSSWHASTHSPKWSVEKNAMELSDSDAEKITLLINRKYTFYQCGFQEKAKTKANDPKQIIIDAMRSGEISREDGTEKLRALSHPNQ